MTRGRAAHAVPAGARVANPRPETAEKRQRILEAAMSIFATRGYNNGSLIEIGEEAGVSHAGVIHHFGSKDQLLIAMLEYRDDSDVAELEGKHIPDGAALFDHLVRTVELNIERPGVVQLYAVLCADSVTEGHPAQDYFRARFVGLREMVRGALADVVPEASDARVDLAASTIIATMDGLQVQWLLDRSAVDMPEAVRLVIASVIDRLRSEAR
ncbi:MULTISPECIES: TetR/AcrR family transcriptional regulator [Leifsonia]|uniref:AcrR family transcriptional regulator n=1 Tax=Leifsonia soli TaxID=582665 RepID=A0A852T2X3_9MICO|nr:MULTISPECIES: TetR/AcrR family transcriptional regulator [Leifsonia]NYD75839.1 AcrR family transcriptional regulator [Leifsonia soli]SEB07402.1 DNA-binding transcriptional regulator, AcrR family [Leifsonia sp. 21MFCrub1.1]